MLLRRLREAIEEMAVGRRKKKIEKEKMKRRGRKYGQAQLKHSRRGIRATFLAVCCLFLLVLAFSASYITRGDVGLLIGVVGLFALALAVVGLKDAVQGFKEREKNYVTCRVGAALNGLLLLGLIAIFLRGLF